MAFSVFRFIPNLVQLCALNWEMFNVKFALAKSFSCKIFCKTNSKAKWRKQTKQIRFNSTFARRLWSWPNLYTLAHKVNEWARRKKTETANWLQFFFIRKSWAKDRKFINTKTFRDRLVFIWIFMIYILTTLW